MNTGKLMKLVFFAAIIILIVVVGISLKGKKEIYQFKGNEMFYSEERGKVEYNLTLNYTSENITIYNVNYKSRKFMGNDTTIYGLVFIPNASENVPGIVFLPGGGVKKESASRLALKMANDGYAVITIDQRGVGQTGEIYLNPQQDYEVTRKGYEPIQHLSVFDGLRAFDVLREIEGMQKDNIGFVGESMGGRYGMIATALDKKIKGIVVISSSGFHVKSDGSAYAPYLISIDPDHYVSRISPREFYMIHAQNDSTVPLKEAEITFNIAGEPKRISVVNESKRTHGFCDYMFDDLSKYLEDMLGK